MGSSQRQPSDASPTALRARAAAKVNLGLYVGPVRADGRYHEVVSVLQSIAIWDELEVEVVPEPRVDSVLLGVTRRQHPAVAGLDQAELSQVIDAAFGQRRKTLRNSLRSLGLDAAGAEALGRAAGVDLGLRAERLDVDAFAALTRALAHQVRSPF